MVSTTGVSISGNMTGPAMRTLRMAGAGFVAVELSDTQASMASMLLPSGSCTKASVRSSATNAW